MPYSRQAVRFDNSPVRTRRRTSVHISNAAYTPRASLSERRNRGSAAIVLADNTAQLCAALFDRPDDPADVLHRGGVEPEPIAATLPGLKSRRQAGFLRGQTPLRRTSPLPPVSRRQRGCCDGPGDTESEHRAMHETFIPAETRPAVRCHQSPSRRIRGHRRTNCGSATVVEFCQQAKNLEVQPDQRHHQGERAVPLKVFGHTPFGRLFDKIKVEH